MSSDDSVTDSEMDEISPNEEAEEQASKKRMFLTKRLPWRSQELEDIEKSLDRKILRKRSQKAVLMTMRRRETDTISARPAPQDAPRWAVRNLP